MYHFISSISHPDKRIADKVNFFADCFRINASKLGVPFGYQLENHRSLLEKIDFQLENYSSKYSPKYIHHYLTHTYLSQKDRLITKHYSKDLKTIFEKYHDNGLSDKKKRLDLQKAIRRCVKKMDKNIFNNALNPIISAILCSQLLKEHDHISIIKYYTPILVSEFIFSGFPHSSLKELFHRILEKEIQLTNNKVSTKAPLPRSLLKLQETGKEELFYTKAQRYLKNRTLKQQFEGLYHLFKDSYLEKRYIFKLANIDAFTKVNLEYGDVLISNQLKQSYVKRKTTKEEYRSFFHGKGALFCQVVVIANNDSVGKQRALQKAREAVEFLNVVCKSYARVLDQDYLLIDRNQNIRLRPLSNQVLHDSDQKAFRDQNLYLRERTKASPLYKRLIDIDKIYVKAYSSTTLEDRLVNYWRYLECFFEANEYEAQTIRETVSSILSKKSIDDSILFHFYLAHKVLYSIYYALKTEEVLGLTHSELNRLLSPGPISNIDLVQLNKLIRHPYVTKKISKFCSMSQEQKQNIAQEHYLSVLFETYEQRCFVEHGGISFPKAVDKILYSLPQMVYRFRELVVMQIEAKTYTSFNDVLNDLK